MCGFYHRLIMYLLNVRVAPLNSKLDGAALVVLPNGPIMVSRKQASSEEIIVMGFHQQSHRVTCQNVLLANGPCRPFYVYLISTDEHCNRPIPLLIPYVNFHVQRPRKFYATCDGIDSPSLIACSLLLILGSSPKRSNQKHT